MIYPHALNINHDPAVAGPCIICKANIFMNADPCCVAWTGNGLLPSEGSFSLGQSFSLLKTFAVMLLSFLGTIRLK